MRRSVMTLRSAKGYGWYNKFIKSGQEGFSKNKPPTPFNWDEILDISGPHGSPKVVESRRKAYFNLNVDDSPLGKLVFELADDVVPEIVQNFVNLCEGKGKYSYQNSKLHSISKGKGWHSAFSIWVTLR